MTPREDLLRLIKEKSVKVGGPFKLSAGGESKLLIDLSQVLRSKEGKELLIECTKKIIEWDVYDEIDSIGGPLTGSDLIALPLLGLAANRCFGVRKENKEALGLDTLRITGDFKPRDRVLLVDDVITTGKSIIDAGNLIRENYGSIESIFCVVNRGGMKQVCTAFDVTGRALFGRKDFTEYL